jgi:hypothetical protein
MEFTDRYLIPVLRTQFGLFPGVDYTPLHLLAGSTGPVPLSLRVQNAFDILLFIRYLHSISPVDASISILDYEYSVNAAKVIALPEDQQRFSILASPDGTFATFNTHFRPFVTFTKPHLTQETFPLRLYVLLVTLFLLFCRIQLVEG